MIEVAHQTRFRCTPCIAHGTVSHKARLHDRFMSDGVSHCGNKYAKHHKKHEGHGMDKLKSNGELASRLTYVKSMHGRHYRLLSISDVNEADSKKSRGVMM